MPTHKRPATANRRTGVIPRPVQARLGEPVAGTWTDASAMQCAADRLFRAHLIDHTTYLAIMAAIVASWPGYDPMPF